MKIPFFGNQKNSALNELIDAADKVNNQQQINNAISINSDELSSFISGGMNAGVAVNEQSAMKVSAVYASVALIGGAIASLPLPIYKYSGGDREKTDHPAWWLLNRQPSPICSAAVFWESFIGSLLLHGDGFAKIIRPSKVSRDVIGFEWYKKSEVEVLEDKGRLIYVLQRDNKRETVSQDDMIHVPGPGFNGKNGMSQIKYVLLNAAGIAIAADQFSSAFFKNGARPDFALEFPSSITEDQQDMIRRTWGDRHQGPSNAHLPALMSGGAKVHELTMNAEDAQLITTREFQVEDIARIFGVPPHMIGHTKNNTSWGTGVEQMSIGFVKYTLGRYLVKIEQELNRKLFGNTREYFAEFNTAGLERGDYKTRMEGYRIALGRAGEPGWLTQQEIRKLENLSTEPKAGTLNKGQTNESTTEAISAE
ncbi:MAG: HK97 family phage portal protein [Cycloclasticus pugetii]|jgi:HK97 family phage portal protein